MEVTMAPFELTTWGVAAEPIAHVLLGTGFGFVLERAGFGSAKRLTNQFYLNDMTVLKVMFTAILTAMVLVMSFATFGLLDYDRLWVNPTYLGSGILGGLLFGVGFLVGGYCPGTALVSAATLKIDGLLFILGALGGILVFGYTEPWLDGFWNDSGNYGRLTLFDWLGLPMPVVVLLVIAVAVLVFAVAEWVERIVNRDRDASDQPAKRWRPAYGYAIALLGTAAAMALVWNPTSRLRRTTIEARIDASIRAHQVQIDPRELADLMRDQRLGLALLDLRDESSFNRFHLLDAKRFDAKRNAPPQLPSRQIKVLLGDDETAELRAFRKLATQQVENLYVLAGGIPAWLDLFDARGSDPPQAALGANHPFSRPPLLQESAAIDYVARVKRPGLGAKKAGGGCGG
jgi:hypothetical protein